MITIVIAITITLMIRNFSNKSCFIVITSFNLVSISWTTSFNGLHLPSHSSGLGQYFSSVVIFGLLGSDFITNRSFGVNSIAWANLVFAGILFLAYRYSSQSKTMLQLSILTVLFIGLFQVFALIPGASRSGTVITAALLVGLNLKEASKFAFLLSIPTILGALVFLIIDSINSFAAINLLSLFIGFSVSAIFAFFTIKFFLAFIDKIGMYPFVIYRLLLGFTLLNIII